MARYATSTLLFSSANINFQITVGELKAVAKASAEFDRYLEAVHGTDDIGRAERNVDRADDQFKLMLKTMRAMQEAREESPPPVKASSSRKGKKKRPEPVVMESESSESSDD